VGEALGDAEAEPHSVAAGVVEGQGEGLWLLVPEALSDREAVEVGVEDRHLDALDEKDATAEALRVAEVQVLAEAQREAEREGVVEVEKEAEREAAGVVEAERLWVVLRLPLTVPLAESVARERVGVGVEVRHRDPVEDTVEVGLPEAHTDALEEGERRPESVWKGVALAHRLMVRVVLCVSDALGEAVEEVLSPPLPLPAREAVGPEEVLRVLLLPVEGEAKAENVVESVPLSEKLCVCAIEPEVPPLGVAREAEKVGEGVPLKDGSEGVGAELAEDHTLTVREGE
jgi:hypothetical protein